MGYIPLEVGFCLTIAAATLAAPPEGRATRGRQVFAQCASCHSMDDSTGVGPSLRGVYGRKAGTIAGYRYSKAISGSGVVWDEAALDSFLQAPQRAIPRNKMPYGGLASQRDRQDVIAYLAGAN